MKFTTLIPMRFNDGNEVPEEQLERYIGLFVSKFGGCSDEGTTKGLWLDPADSRVYRDVSRRITVYCNNDRLKDAQEAVIQIGKDLRQLVMYFEVRDYDGIQFLNIPRDEGV